MTEPPSPPDDEIPNPSPGDTGGDGGTADPAADSAGRAAWLVSTGILLSRLSGLVRERVIARYLGVGLAADAFRAALRIPNLMQNLLGEGVLSASFIPVYSRLLGEGRDEEAGRVAGAVAGLLAAVAGVLVFVGVVLARPLAVALTPGFSGERLELTVTLMRILTPGIGALVLSAWCLGVLNSHRRFFLSYVAPVLWNVAQIAAVVAVGVGGATDRDLAVALAWGALIGGVAQLAIQLPGVVQASGGIRPTLAAHLEGVREVMRRFWPVVTGKGVVQVLAYVDLMLASLLATGAVAALGFAQIFYTLPIALFGMSVAAAELPELSRLGPGSTEEARRRIVAGLTRMAFYVAPVTAAYLAFGDLVVEALLGVGDFDAADVRLVWMVVGAYSLGLLATTASRLLQNAAYASGDTVGPSVIAAVRVAVAAGMGALLMFPFDRVVVTAGGLVGLDSIPLLAGPLPEALREGGGDLRLGAVGLTLASGLAAWLELVLLRRRLGPLGRGLSVGGTHRTAVLTGSMVAAVVGAALRSAVGDLDPVLALALAGGPAALAYLAVTRAWGHPEARQVLARLPGGRR